MTQGKPSEGTFDQLLSVLDRLPFVASLKKDTSLLRNLVVRRRVPRIACIGDVALGRELLGRAVFARAPGETTVPPPGELRAGFGRGDWVRVSTSWGRMDWIEFDRSGVGEATPEGSSTDPKAVLARPLEAPDVLVAVHLMEPNGSVSTAFVEEVAELRAAWGKAQVPSSAGKTATESGAGAIPLLVLLMPPASPVEGSAFDAHRSNLERALTEVGSRPQSVEVMKRDGAKVADPSIERLSEALLDVLPEATKLEAARALLFATKGRRRVAGQVVHSCATLALTIGLAPVPLSDVAVILPLQLMMVSVVAYLGGRELDRKAALEWVASLGVVGGAGLGLRWTAQQLLKLVPGAGTVVSGSVAGAGTVALGQSAVAYFLDRNNAPRDE